MEKDGIWVESWKVPAFMVDAEQKIKYRAIADIFQELANNHANFRKVGYEDMKALGKFWVLNRQAIVIDEWPKWEEEIRVESWISMMKGPFSLRNFAIIDARQKPLVRASYLWTSIDRKKMKPIAFPEGDFPIIPQRNFELPEPIKFRIAESEILQSFELTVRRSDLDIIGHTNNAVYLQWAADCLEGDEQKLRHINANYVGESFEGNEIKIQKTKTEKAIELSIFITNGKELCRIRFT